MQSGITWTTPNGNTIEQTVSTGSTEYFNYFTRIMHRDRFNSLHNPYHWRSTIAACKALSQIHVPEPAQQVLEGWIKDRILESRKKRRGKAVLTAQREAQWVSRQALWQCGCRMETTPIMCVHMRAKMECLFVVDESVPPIANGKRRAYFSLAPERDSVLTPELVLDEDMEDVVQLASTQGISDVYHIQTPTSLCLIPGNDGNGNISNNLQNFCVARNKQLADPLVVEELHRRFRTYCTGSGGGGVLKVYSRRRPRMREVGECLDVLVRARRIVEVLDEVQKELGASPSGRGETGAGIEGEEVGHGVEEEVNHGEQDAEMGADCDLDVEMENGEAAAEFAVQDKRDGLEPCETNDNPTTMRIGVRWELGE